MKNDFETQQTREKLDDYLGKLRRISRSQPRRQWIREIREAFGMTSRIFARRMGISQPAAVLLERSERMETIKIGTLRRAAAALECELVYAFMPKKLSLHTILHNRRCAIAEKDLIAAVQDFKKLPVITQVFSIDKAARKINKKRVWEEGEN
jgi:predicted DNA-binding mobile mystery protein A